MFGLRQLLIAAICVAPFTFAPLPLGAITPKGWLQSQLRLMADGLAGHEYEFYRYVSKSSWLGGSSEYSDLHEGFPYWLNGIVPLAYSIGDDKLKAQIKESVEYVLSHQADDGWLGPETVSSGLRNLWARYPLLLGLTQLLEADQSYESTVLPAIRKFTDLTQNMLQDNGAGLLPRPGDHLSDQDHGWGRIRIADLILTMQWLYENDEEAKQDQLLEIMGMLRKGGLDWATWYTDKQYIKGDLNDADQAYVEAWFPFEHGVNVAQGLKTGAVINRFEHNQTMIDMARRAVDWTFKYHGSTSGTILADERLQGLSPYYGSELCTTVETMYSLTYLYQALGDRDFADRAELAAFNALPAAVLGDWWSHQYVTQPNQPYSVTLNKSKGLPFWNVNEKGQTFGLEPDYPCCTVNHPQGYPKFLANSWVKVGSDGVGHALLSPSSLTWKLDNGAQVTVDANTNYPFSDNLDYEIVASKDFTLHVRIPSWSKTASWSYSGPGDKNEGTAQNAEPDARTGLISIPVSAGKSTARLVLTRSIETISRMNDAVAIMHGPLLYTLDVGYHATSSPPKWYNSSADVSGPLPTESKDWEIRNTTSWNMAIDTSTIQVKSQDNSGNLPDEVWSRGAVPIHLEAEGREVDWPLWRGVPGQVPLKKNYLSDRRPITLVPVGVAKIGMVELPTL
ncbi:hypothetical protein BT63DRAFT_432583 [Microthyrium microscopicum]|uniref:Non-reducing end beta-L-arabinofuranosidase-like GH127 middle domain-containing protein n=1 Tax=Microthyrium microscopicum TaxID=703497 RepID=A0A6A6UGC1_9PEZI|nr:hypothetical protein BT63DRAFT_432583 [Microthyrium microscopicum]